MSVDKSHIVKNQEQVAKEFKVSYRTVSRWINDGMPVEPDGSYNTLDIYKWRKKRADKNKDKDKAFYEKELKRIKLEKDRIELKKIKGDLIPKEEVLKGRLDRILMVKRVLSSLPREVAPILSNMIDPRDIESFLSDKIKEVCSVFAGAK